MVSKKKTELEKALGKLISEIQKHVDDNDSVSASEFSLNVMDSAHELLMARVKEEIIRLLHGKSVDQYLGETWVKSRPKVFAKVKDVQCLLENECIYRDK